MFWSVFCRNIQFGNWVVIFAPCSYLMFVDTKLIMPFVPTKKALPPVGEITLDIFLLIVAVAFWGVLAFRFILQLSSLFHAGLSSGFLFIK